MADLYYVQINALSANDINMLRKSKPVDKVNLFCPTDETVSVQTLTMLNDVAAQLRFIELENEMTLYFCLGQDSMQKGINIIPLSGINVPTGMLGKNGTEKKKRAPRKKKETKNDVIEKDVSPAEESKSQEDPVAKVVSDKNIEMPEPTEATAAENTDTESGNNEISGDIWVSNNAKEYFASHSGIPDDAPDRDNMIDNIAAIIHKHKKISMAIAEIEEKYSKEIADAIKNNINMLIIYIDGGMFKEKDIK